MILACFSASCCFSALNLVLSFCINSESDALKRELLMSDSSTRFCCKKEVIESVFFLVSSYHGSGERTLHVLHANWRRLNKHRAAKKEE